MKILAISQYYTPDITAAAFRIAETVKHLGSLGNEVRVITTFPHKNKVEEVIESGENGIYRVQVPDTENKGFLGYIYLYLSFLIKSLFEGIRVGKIQKPDVIWATSPPVFVGFAGWILSKILGAGLVLDVRDIWPDSAVAAGQISDTGFSYKIGSILEKFLYEYADIVTCVAKPMKKYIQRYTDKRVEVIYNGVEISSELEWGNGEKDDVLKDQLNEKNAKKILYAGNFGHVQQLDILLDVFSEINLEELCENWEIFFLGGGAQKENLEKLANIYELTKQVHFLDPVPKEKVFDYLKSADVLFIHLMDSKVLSLTIPSKVFDYMLADRPLLAGIKGEGKKIINSVEGNFVFEPGNKENLKQTFKKLDKNFSENGLHNNAPIVKRYFSRKIQSEKLNKILKQSLMNKG